MKIVYTFLGILFGIVLTKSEVISWFRIHDMFLFNEAHMYLIISTAIAVGIVSIFLIKKLKVKSLDGSEIKLNVKPYNKGTLIGGLIFGIGWAITGACPGPIFAQIGAGEFPAIFTLIGALLGAYIYHSIKKKLPH